jgi:hypothetical protein
MSNILIKTIEEMFVDVKTFTEKYPNPITSENFSSFLDIFYSNLELNISLEETLRDFLKSDEPISRHNGICKRIRSLIQLDIEDMSNRLEIEVPKVYKNRFASHNCTVFDYEHVGFDANEYFNKINLSLQEEKECLMLNFKKYENGYQPFVYTSTDKLEDEEIRYNSKIINYDQDINQPDIYAGCKILSIMNYRLNGEKLDFDTTYALFNTVHENYIKNMADNPSYKFIFSPEQVEEFLYDNEVIYNNYETILLIYACVKRYKEWFLCSKDYLHFVKTDFVPEILDLQYHIFKIREDKFDIKKLVHHNIQYILDYTSLIDEKTFLKTLNKAKKVFSQRFESEIKEFKKQINRLQREEKIFLTTTNISAAFYFDDKRWNAFVENIYEYDSDRLYKKYRPKDKEFIHIDGNYDYVEFMPVRAKKGSHRIVYRGSTQVNNFLARINREFENAFKKSQYLGYFDQDTAIRNMNRVIEENPDFKSYNTDITKYSDTLVIALFKTITDLMFDDPKLSKEVCELLNSDIMYHGKKEPHISSLMGLYFDFAMITLCNVFVMFMLEIIVGQEALFINAVGDDNVIIFLRKDDRDYFPYLKSLWAYFNCYTNDKSERCQGGEGIVSYLKYTAVFKKGKVHNISGLSPTILFKKVESYQRVIAALRYMNKSRYIDVRQNPGICLSIIEDFCNTFNAEIKKQGYRQGYDERAIHYIDIHAKRIMLTRGYIIGGPYEFDIMTAEGRNKLIEYLEHNKVSLQSEIQAQTTSIPFIKELCEEAEIAIEDCILYQDIYEYEVYGISSLYKILSNFETWKKDFLKSELAQQKIILKQIRRLLSEIYSNKFKIGQAGKMSTDRVNRLKFADDDLLFKSKIPMNIRTLALMKMSDVQPGLVNNSRTAYTMISTVFSNQMTTKITKDSQTGVCFHLKSDDDAVDVDFTAERSSKYKITFKKFCELLYSGNERLWKLLSNMLYNKVNDFALRDSLIREFSEDPDRLVDVMDTINRTYKKLDAKIVTAACSDVRSFKDVTSALDMLKKLDPNFDDDFITTMSDMINKYTDRDELIERLKKLRKMYLEVAGLLPNKECNDDTEKYLNSLIEVVEEDRISELDHLRNSSLFDQLSEVQDKYNDFYEENLDPVISAEEIHIKDIGMLSDTSSQVTKDIRKLRKYTNLFKNYYGRDGELIKGGKFSSDSVRDEMLNSIGFRAKIDTSGAKNTYFLTAAEKIEAQKESIDIDAIDKLLLIVKDSNIRFRIKKSNNIIIMYFPSENPDTVDSNRVNNREDITPDNVQYISNKVAEEVSFDCVNLAQYTKEEIAELGLDPKIYDNLGYLEDGLILLKSGESINEHIKDFYYVDVVEDKLFLTFMQFEKLYYTGDGLWITSFIEEQELIVAKFKVVDDLYYYCTETKIISNYKTITWKDDDFYSSDQIEKIEKRRKEEKSKITKDSTQNTLKKSNKFGNK